MEWNKKFNYPSSTRALIQGKRHYSLDELTYPLLQPYSQQQKVKRTKLH